MPESTGGLVDGAAGRPPLFLRLRFSGLSCQLSALSRSRCWKLPSARSRARSSFSRHRLGEMPCVHRAPLRSVVVWFKRARCLCLFLLLHPEVDQAADGFGTAAVVRERGGVANVRNVQQAVSENGPCLHLESPSRRGEEALVAVVSRCIHKHQPHVREAASRADFDQSLGQEFRRTHHREVAGWYFQPFPAKLLLDPSFGRVCRTKDRICAGDIGPR